VRSRLAALPLALLVSATVAAAAAPRWKQGAVLPVPRSEVAATLAAGEIYVVGGFLADGQPSNRVDAYSPRTNRWRRITDLPVTAHHPMATAHRGRVYVLGGYGPDGARQSSFVLAGGVWTALPPMPESRAAGGAAVIGGKLYVVGGVTTTAGARSLARQTLVYDIARRTWSLAPGPTRREHLGVTALNGRLYAVGGRTAGFDTNLAAFESYRPGARSWLRLAPVPGKRGGTAAGAVGRFVVSAGGEAPGGTIRTVFAYDTRARRWRRLPNLPTPRHGLGVVGAGGRVYVVAGGRQPGLAGVSGANESLRVP
jgi:Kelch motif/Galactose oxidase, central domain